MKTCQITWANYNNRFFLPKFIIIFVNENVTEYKKRNQYWQLPYFTVTFRNYCQFLWGMVVVQHWYRYPQRHKYFSQWVTPQQHIPVNVVWSKCFVCSNRISGISPNLVKIMTLTSDNYFGCGSEFRPHCFHDSYSINEHNIFSIVS